MTNEATDGNLTSEQVEALMSSDNQGDIGGKPNDEASMPNAGSEDGAIDYDTLTAENAVILAKDQKHTISYDKLVEARDQSKHWKQQALDATAELERLQAEAAQRAESGQSATTQDNQVAAAQAAIDAGVDPELFGDFSEEALANGINKLVEQRVNALMQPLQQREAQTEAEAHQSAIYEAHPDADSIYESQEFAAWKASKPSFIQQSLDAVLANGTTSEVVELFSVFKAEAGTGGNSSIHSAAGKALANAAKAVPHSLSDIAGGRANPSSKAEGMANMGGADLLDAMSSMTPEQIEAHLNSL